MPQPGVMGASGLSEGGAKPPLKKPDWNKGHLRVANANSPFAAELFLQMNRARSDPVTYADEMYSETAKETLLKQNPAPPLQLISSGMTKACLDHVQDMKKVDLLTVQDVHTGRDGSNPLARMERYGDCVGDVAAEMVLLKPAKKAERPDKADVAADVRAVMTQMIEDPGKLEILFRSDWRASGIGSGMYGKGGRMVVCTFTTEFDDNPCTPTHSRRAAARSPSARGLARVGTPRGWTSTSRRASLARAAASASSRPSRSTSKSLCRAPSCDEAPQPGAPLWSRFQAASLFIERGTASDVAVSYKR
uniref:SCP domain-containing protein n=1 Tax=Emiliania huxleyi TaxID=2903 RepID=A0A6T0BJZ7_EMIHU|mmetsp:Transcript_13604/g.38973  ORF Transcript_13604/g.38973 Transcript_13604/m.38973 type:complete len:306 (+) Transcript_13604:95-1012(+)